MNYLMYLIIFVICTIYGIGADKITNFVDSISLGFVVLPTIFVLILSDYMADFIGSLKALFKKEGITKKMLDSIKLSCIASIGFGFLGTLIYCINMLHGMDLEYTNIGMDISVGLICMFYACCLNLLLIPMYFILKKKLVHNKEGAK